MKPSNCIPIWRTEEYDWPAAGKFIPELHSYLHEDTESPRPAVIVLPGGAYRAVSPGEGAPVAEKFYALGYQAFVLTYTTDLFGMMPLKSQPLLDVSRAVRYVRAHAAEFGVDPQMVLLCGFSAGGHLAADLAVHFLDVPDPDPRYAGPFRNRPNGVILGYPVITAGQYAHDMTIATRAGKDAPQQQRKQLSLETQVTPMTPPFFIWHTVTDDIVPYENSLLMLRALKDAGVLAECHLFPEGPHGLSLANAYWASGEYDGAYTLAQMNDFLEAVRNGTYPLPDAARQALEHLQQPQGKTLQPYEDVAVWPELADRWARLHIKTETEKLHTRLASFLRPEVPSPDKYCIACIGDSITYGAGVEADRTNQSYEAHLQKSLPENWQVLNYGFSGTTLQDEGDLPYQRTPQAQASLKCGARIYLIMFGTNDSKPQNWEPERFSRELDLFVERYRSLPQQPKVYVMIPPACFPKTPGGTVVADISEQTLQSQIRPLLRKRAAEAGWGCIDLYAPTQGHPEYFADGVHPNAEGNRLIAQTIASHLSVCLSDTASHKAQGAVL